MSMEWLLVEIASMMVCCLRGVDVLGVELFVVGVGRSEVGVD